MTPFGDIARTFWRDALLLTLIERLCDLAAAHVTPWYILDAERRPVRCHSLMEWGRFTESPARVVGEDLVAGGRLSTTCVGWDLSPKLTAKGREPLTFETMWFSHVDLGDDRLYPPCGRGRLPAAEQRVRLLGRYGTWEEAERGHAAARLSLQQGYGEEPSCLHG